MQKERSPVLHTQNQYEYYGINRYISIEGIALDQFSASKQTSPLSTPPQCKRHAVFHYLLHDDRKQDADTTAAHIKYPIE